MSEFKHIVNVIPLTRVGLSSTQIFTYLVPLKLQGQIRLGQLVKIPFGTRECLGITSSLEMHRLKNETKKFKELMEIVDIAPVMTKKNLELADWLSNRYVCSLGLVVKAMLPTYTKHPCPPDTVGFEKHNPDFVLTEQQRKAVVHLTNSLDKNKIFLLHGVTGSGKTEIYMQIIERLLPNGKQIIMLVPEISLTTQAVERFARRFGIEKIALLHSDLKDTERIWMWHQIREGEKSIIIGPRSAIFAPIRDLGLIVLDEEHDSSYKQYEQAPKYHAREVAKKLSELWSCPLILGDATPSIETFYEASIEKLNYLRLPHRIKADVGLPRVAIIDMREELKSQNFSILSEYLKLAILDNLKNQRQIILFLNRRGASTVVLCRDCGHIANCENCSNNLVWHTASKNLMCHHCGRKYPYPALCPKCGSARIKHLGIGTQLVEEELWKFLKKNWKNHKDIIVARMDRDTAGKADKAAKIYKAWAGGKIGILIGTQMISKGWDVSRVGLVGIISADTILHLPDFRSSERTFQILTQVAGRTGRGLKPGLVILQTYNPQNPAIVASRTHDYEGFFQTEIGVREKLGYPPFTKMVKLTFRHTDEENALDKARTVLRTLLSKKEFPIEVIGPIPSFLTKLRDRYQYQIILKLDAQKNYDLYKYLQDLPSDVDIDIDPETLL